jgi:TIR domain
LFLSHSSKDAEFARKLARDLGGLGVNVWFSEWDLNAGQSLIRSIRSAIRKSQFVGILVSPAFLASSWAQKELRLAQTQERQQARALIILLLYRATARPVLADERLFLDLRSRYFDSLTELAGMIHKIGRRRLSESLLVARPRSLGAAVSVLRDLGRDDVELIESEAFAELSNLRGVRAGGNVMTFYPDQVPRLNPQMSRWARQLVLAARREKLGVRVRGAGPQKK